MNTVKKPDITLVCSDCDYTRILYHGIKNDFNIARIIIENPPGKKQLIKRRLKRLGFLTVAGQLLFQAGYVPFLRFRSRNKIKNILRSQQLDISPMPETIITRVPS